MSGKDTTDITELYIELGEKLSQIKGIEWVDLWNNQVTKMDDEHPFPTPAIFIAFRSQNAKDLSMKMQEVDLMVDIFLFYETFADTYKGAFNQEDALQYLSLQKEINKVMHGSDGNHYSNMRRVGFAPIDTGDAGNLYGINYQCKMIDKSAVEEIQTGTFNDISFEGNEFKIPMEFPDQIS